MEKIAIGVPYEISIEPSIDIGAFDAELVISKKDFRVGLKLKKVKGTDIDYTFIIPTNLKDVLKKAQAKYSIFVYKENARFEVDDGQLKFIDEKDFKVRVKDNAKMRPVETEEEPEVKDDVKEEKPEPTKEPKKPKKEKTKENYSPEDLAQMLIDNQLSTETAIKPSPQPPKKPVSTPLPERVTSPSPTATTNEKNLGSILSEIEDRKAAKRKRDQVNRNIQNALHNKD